MRKVRNVRAMLKQILNVAAEEIFQVFERTIEEYEEELCRSKEENERRQRKLLDALLKPRVPLHTTDVQKTSLRGQEEDDDDDVPSQWEEPAEPPHIKEEVEDVWNGGNEEQLRGVEETGVATLPSTEREDGGQLSERRHPQSEENRSGGTSSSQRVKTEGGGQHGDRSQAGSIAPLSNMDDAMECGSSVKQEEPLRIKEEDMNGEQLQRLKKDADVPAFALTAEGQKKSHMKQHMKRHTDDKPFSCSVCAKQFRQKSHVGKHMRTHAAENHFACANCTNSYTSINDLISHWATHIEENPSTASSSSQLLTKEADGEGSQGSQTGNIAPRSQMDGPMECGSSVKQEEPAEPPHIKEEAQDVWSSQNREQRRGLEEVCVTTLPLTSVFVKLEEDGGQSSRPHHSKSDKKSSRHMTKEADSKHGTTSHSSDADDHAKNPLETDKNSEDVQAVVGAESKRSGSLRASLDNLTSHMKTHVEENPSASGSSSQRLTTEADGEHCEDLEKTHKSTHG
ncbi:zinc finger protein 236-like [Phycodurus eques]|uniref:zinc finger protein 236-like n=1 Tax=Phycodurus eques TaxID=693459 RepID=UPI002ACE6D3C|nr:zinc finger protein 236-like [Phycodurus eques]